MKEDNAAVVYVRVDPAVRGEFDKICRALRRSRSNALRLLMERFIAEWNVGDAEARAKLLLVPPK